ncbi:carbohydrate ABC transporter substrate-binding protein, CUT1 family (TC 3.A.1.1.-) [Pseudoduganella lurida]|uniref:Carbohydrate ABC transporter substrate-binding protein, CUT1 family (TC 3.A.1.1.-) n=1 Tax=Pseudoduganella lurida TaxID=1036180 RepID=A0A562RLC5_9BURK|nr:extracellular solute-binding protein [Pseudoduganella lurida]TWI69256.1 carbohydrate ABC transporter substrate-binding protein, CUT1 family (TC 3.A.1.1.-) [Pseudoduganella lurida]
MKRLICTLLVAWTLPALAAPVEIRLWRHDTGDVEMVASRAAVQRFNHAQGRWKVVVEAIPQGSYTESITAASLVGQLPCIIAMDQPTVPNFAWAGHIRPLDGLLPASAVAPLLEGGLGRYRGALYSVGQFDVVLALFARRSQLAALGIRIATPDHPYSAAEFHDVLVKAKRGGRYRFPLDLNGRFKGEWYSYAFSPWLRSAGTDLIDRRDYLRVDGFLNGDAAVGVGRYYGRLFKDGLVERIPADDKAFEQGRVLFHYTGSWKAREYAQQFGDDLVVMPPPDFGQGPKIGAASWQWGITRSCRQPEGAAAFLAHLIAPAEMAAASRDTGLVPVTAQSAALTEHYRPGGDWRIYFEFAQRFAQPRPATPGYPAISSAFEKAMADIRSGRDAAEAYDEAVEAIEHNIARNGGYGFDARTAGGSK